MLHRVAVLGCVLLVATTMAAALVHAQRTQRGHTVGPIATPRVEDHDTGAVAAEFQRPNVHGIHAGLFAGTEHIHHAGPPAYEHHDARHHLERPPLLRLALWGVPCSVLGWALLQLLLAALRDRRPSHNNSHAGKRGAAATAAGAAARWRATGVFALHWLAAFCRLVWLPVTSVLAASVVLASWATYGYGHYDTDPRSVPLSTGPALHTLHVDAARAALYWSLVAAGVLVSGVSAWIVCCGGVRWGGRTGAAGGGRGAGRECPPYWVRADVHRLGTDCCGPSTRVPSAAAYDVQHADADDVDVDDRNVAGADRVDAADADDVDDDDDRLSLPTRR